jgi:hypothetical protein
MACFRGGRYLGQYDCVAFYDYLETIRTSTLSYNPSAWVFMDAATMLFEVGAREPPGSSGSMQRLILFHGPIASLWPVFAQ